MIGSVIKTGGIGTTTTAHLNFTVCLAPESKRPTGERHRRGNPSQVPDELKADYRAAMRKGIRAKEALEIARSNHSPALHTLSR